MQLTEQTKPDTRRQSLAALRMLSAPMHLIGRRVRPLSRRIATLIGRQDAGLVLDLRETCKIDVGGIVLLLETQSLLRAGGHELQLLCNEGPVLRLLESLDLHLEITVLTDPAQVRRATDSPAVESLRRIA